MNCTPFTVWRHPLFRIHFFNVHFTMWHYALALPYCHRKKQLMVNFGPKFLFFIGNKVRLEFTHFEDRDDWEPAKGLYWELPRPPVGEMEQRFKKYKDHIDIWKYTDEIPNMELDEYYDLDDNNCEHFCSSIIYGKRFSSQADVF